MADLVDNSENLAYIVKEVIVQQAPVMYANPNNNINNQEIVLDTKTQYPYQTQVPQQYMPNSPLFMKVFFFSLYNSYSAKGRLAK